MQDGYKFLLATLSKPLRLNDLAIGDLFIVFPQDGDDSGHGGFRGACQVFEKLEPRGQQYTCRKSGSIDFTFLPLSTPVIKITFVT